jgi:hypothetical protein
MVCAQCEGPCGQRSCSAVPAFKRASDRHLRPPCQTCRRPSRGPTSLPLQRPARPLRLLKLTKIWQSLGNELSQWKLPGIPNFRGRPLQKRRVFVQGASFPVRARTAIVTVAVVRDSEAAAAPHFSKCCWMHHGLPSRIQQHPFSVIRLCQ